MGIRTTNLSAVQVVSDEQDCPRPPEGTIVTIGAYDGVHLGHRKVIAEVCERARAEGRKSAVITFDRHPAQVIRPESAPLLLTDLDQKLELLGATGVDYVLVIHFDAARSTESAEDFIRQELVGCLNASTVVVGEDFHFGHNRLGNVALLNEMGSDLGFETVGHRLVDVHGHAARDDEQVSSTAIRRALSEGRPEVAARMLGRPHEVRGPVVVGDKRGRQIGFPTANVAVPDTMLIPTEGIYSGELVLDSGGRVLPSAVYIGKRPTFYDDSARTVVEVHALDFEGDLYSEVVAVRFHDFIRTDEKFDSVEDLAAQLQRDCDEARRLLAAP